METRERPSLCACGCGQEVRLATRNDYQQGYIVGQPRRFINGHNSRGPAHPSWKGGRITNGDGYILVYAPTHPRARGNCMLEHILVAEAALGKYLPPKAIVHHINEDPADNRRENLVICQDFAYHKLLHYRLRALRACGHAGWRLCTLCGQYDDLSNLKVWGKKRKIVRHLACAQAARRTYNQQQKERTLSKQVTEIS